MNESKVKVAISLDFFESFAKIPRNQQSKVTRFIEEFRKNPMSPGINYEKITHARDNKLHSIRIDQTYRGIILKPDAGNVYVLLWVDHHDKAYKWAENRVCKINPDTGSLQVFEVDMSESPIKEKPELKTMPGLFDAFRDRQLLRLGLPEEFIPMIRTLKSEDDLDTIEEKLPQEAYEALYMLAAGYKENEVLIEQGLIAQKSQVDTEDYVSALDNADTLRRFYVVDDELELQAILNAPLEKWRVFLHPTQRNLVERDWNGPVRVLGGAGTGKTIVALHRAKWLAENKCIEKNDKILFLTFTRNLTADLQENLKKICKPEILKRIEVVNLDRWVSAAKQGKP